MSGRQFLVEHVERNAEKKSCDLQNENRCLQISEKSSVARANEAADILQIEEVGLKDAVQSPQEASGLTNVAILLAATSDRRKFLDAVGKGAKMLTSGEKLAEEEGPEIDASFARSGGESNPQSTVQVHGLHFPQRLNSAQSTIHCPSTWFALSSQVE